LGCNSHAGVELRSRGKAPLFPRRGASFHGQEFEYCGRPFLTKVQWATFQQVTAIPKPSAETVKFEYVVTNTTIEKYAKPDNIG
jgi:hypothetical protein